MLQTVQVRSLVNTLVNIFSSLDDDGLMLLSCTTISTNKCQFLVFTVIIYVYVSELLHVALIVFGTFAHCNLHSSARQQNQVLIAQNRAHKNIDCLEMFHYKETA